MVVNDLGVERVPVTRDEAGSPLVVNTDPPLPLPVSLELLKPVRGWTREVFESRSGIQHAQFSDGNLLQVRGKPARALKVKQPFRLTVSPTPYHDCSITRDGINVQRYRARWLSCETNGRSANRTRART